MNLIYYVIGGHPEYKDLLEFSLETVKRNTKCDIMVMCDASYAPHISHLSINHIHITPDNPNHIHASMRKTEIFNFKHIHLYDKVLYLDCDIVADGSLDLVFHTITNPFKLYVVPDKHSYSFTSDYFSCKDKPYTTEEFSNFQSNSIKPFNAGQFGFCNSNSMREHFEQVCALKQSYDPKYHFYEQSFMNYHFCRANAVCYDLSSHVSLYSPNRNRRLINHFCNVSNPPKKKLASMKLYCAKKR